MRDARRTATGSSRWRRTLPLSWSSWVMSWPTRPSWWSWCWGWLSTGAPSGGRGAGVGCRRRAARCCRLRRRRCRRCRRRRRLMGNRPRAGRGKRRVLEVQRAESEKGHGHERRRPAHAQPPIERPAHEAPQSPFRSIGPLHLFRVRPRWSEPPLDLEGVLAVVVGHGAIVGSPAMGGELIPASRRATVVRSRSSRATSNCLPGRVRAISRNNT